MSQLEKSAINFLPRLNAMPYFLLDAQNYTLKDITADRLGCFVNNSTFRCDYELRDDWVCTRKKNKGKVNRDSLKTATNIVVKT